MNETLTKLQTITVGSGGVSSVTFSNIPQNYTDLVVKVSHRCDDIYPDTGFLLRFNGSTSNLSRITLYGYGTSGSQASTSSSSLINFFSTANGATANTFSNTDIYIPNYASANYKSVSIDSVNEGNSVNVLADLVAGLWSNTSAITSITLLSATSTNIMQYSSFSLYGVKALRTAVGNSIKATGGAITFDGTYIYHTFTSTGAFTPTSALTADILVVAGGGGGGYQQGGGGGAGGLLGFASQSLSSGTGYTCTVGSGGNGSGSTHGSDGNNSSFTGLTAAVGGGGGGSNGPNADSGGSGGGAGIGGSTYGTATSGQGNNGGARTGSGDGGAGGGGAGAVGGNCGGSGTPAGNGGNGSSAYSAWGVATSTGQNVSGTYYFAGGGAGGAGGASTQVAAAGGYGGGALGVYGNNVGNAGTANTGGGGGGGAQQALPYGGGNGGSGIIIVRYKA